MREEIEAFGCPPALPGAPHFGRPCPSYEALVERQQTLKLHTAHLESQEDEAERAAKAAAKAAAKKDAAAAAPKGRAKKTKLASKAGNVVYQWDILLSSGVPAEEIPKFQDPVHWLSYFPPRGNNTERKENEILKKK